MLWNFNSMTDAQIDRAAERYYDRLLDRYYGGEDAWEHYEPDWTEVCDIVNDFDPEEVAQYVRDFLDGDGDLMTEVYRAGLLAQYIHPEEENTKDPDDEWAMIDRVFEREWQNDDLMNSIWDNHEPVRKGVCERLKERADMDGTDDIRERYNKQKADEAEAAEEWEHEHRRRD